MEPEGPPESESSEKAFFSQQEDDEEEEDEEEPKEPEETVPLNPLLQPALTGDVEGLQTIFEDPENPHHDQAMQLLLEEDIVGRNLLYAACMAGQSDVIKALAKYGVNLNEKTTRGILSFSLISITYDYLRHYVPSLKLDKFDVPDLCFAYICIHTYAYASMCIHVDKSIL